MCGVQVNPKSSTEKCIICTKINFISAGVYDKYDESLKF